MLLSFTYANTILTTDQLVAIRYCLKDGIILGWGSNHVKKLLEQSFEYSMKHLIVAMPYPPK